MKKRILALFLAAVIFLFAVGCGKGSSSNTGSVLADIVSGDVEYFSDGDFKDVSGETPNATITLSGSEGTISDTTRGSSGETVTITAKGIYRITGSSENVTITVNDSKESGNIYLVLDNVTMKNSSAPCIVVEAADKVIVQCVGDNSLTYTSTSAEQDGAIYSSDDITLNGSGSLVINSARHGIVGKDDVKITGAAISLNTSSIGIKANDSVRIGGGELNIVSSHDGIQVDSDEGTGYFYMSDGTVNITSGYDGIDVKTDAETNSEYALLVGGSVNITAGGGSANSQSSTSQKGIKCSGDIKTGDAKITVSSADDALHSGNDILITDGVLNLASSDDGIHADSTLTISGGKVNVTKSYEGLEGMVINLSGGDVNVYASDDGVNAAGGSDTTSTEAWPSKWGGASSSSGTLNISGGNIYVNSKGDGLDSNGSIYVSGGYVIVEGPTDNGNGALDIGDSANCVAEITGGTVLAIGSSGMAVNFNSGSQCSALVSLSGSAGDTITVNDGSGFSFTATKAFSSVVYSSSSLSSGNSYTITAGSASSNIDFSSSSYYSNVSGMGGGMGGMNGGMNGGMGGNFGGRR